MSVGYRSLEFYRLVIGVFGLGKVSWGIMRVEGFCVTVILFDMGFDGEV